VLGTAYYLPPEQAAGQPVTPASDLYALGVVAYECLTGQRPFAGDNAVRVAVAHLREEPPPLPTDIPEPVRHLVMSLLEKDPLARPASAAAVAAAARGLQADPTDAGDAVTTRLLTPLAAAATAPVELSDEVLAADVEPERPHWRGDAYPGQRRVRGLLLLVGLAVVVVGALLLVLVGGGNHKGAAAGGPTPKPTVTPSPTPPTLALVASQYTGRKYDEVSRDLTAMGFTVRRRNVESARSADTVIGIAPSGQVPAGSTVTLTVATPAPKPHDKHGGKGNND
jgi:serine/threonine-protein kinase